MISAPNSYFLTEEARKLGAEPRFIFSISPYLHFAGLDGTGDFWNCRYVPPSRIEIIPDASSAIWTSKAILSANDTFPYDAVVSWTYNGPGYELTVAIRTAQTVSTLLAAPWETLSQAQTISFYQYYQLRISWVGIRSFAFDSPSYDPLAAWALDY